MKKVLITGTNSYIGTSFEKWVEKWPDRYTIDTVDMKDESWREKYFSRYDTLFYVAGIVHIKKAKKNQDIYYKVNRDLAYEVAIKAKAEGVKQFIYLSSMSVYGLETGIINKDTPLEPKSNYGKSKLQAENLIKPLGDENFGVAIIRAPMVYGNKCKGNYLRLSKFVIRMPIFPDFNNKRSLIYIDNMCEFVRLLIDSCKSGLFFPQNKEYVCTSQMAKSIAKIHGKRIWFTNIFNPLLRVLKISSVNKVFGDLIYEKNLSRNVESYCVCDFDTTIKNTERCKNH